MIKFFKKYHKWLGVIFILFFLLFSISGIILNHRELFSGIDVNRNILPSEYQYNNWNNAAVKGTVKINSNKILIYGNIGIWETDSNAVNFSDFNNGLPKGIDNRKICKIIKSNKGNLFAGTFFGLYQFNNEENKWNKIEIPTKEKRITDIIEKQDTLLVMTRSFLLKTTDYQNFNVNTFPKPQNYDNKVSLFKTLWVIHSGEIYGVVGILIVDLVALIFIFLTITGFIFFVNRYRIKAKQKKNKDIVKIANINKWNLKWHNKIGWITSAILLFTTITGMFLRPPFLITIIESKVSKIPYTELDSPNPWFDKLRKITYDDEKNTFNIATLDGVFYSDDNFNSPLKKYKNQPPISMMGVNVFEKIKQNTILIGSFEGLFEWNTSTDEITDYLTKQKYKKPVGRNSERYNVVTGYSKHLKNSEYIFDFNLGAIPIRNSKDIIMPEEIKNRRISLWNLVLEFHTARIYSSFLGMAYILVIPIIGFISIFLIISGFIVWYKKRE
jgi:hypothetical protein